MSTLEGPTADPRSGLRVVVTGKGGVGKTTLTAALARLLARDGRRVLAVDADAQLNLAAALGFPKAEAERLVPLSHDADYVAEKAGARPGEGWGLMFRLNPDVDDVVDRFGQRAPDGVRLLAMGTLTAAGAGCL
ncbi:MAG TPA: AAA family ATPase, partial [Candidatus Limnocylindrales bacterium]